MSKYRYEMGGIIRDTEIDFPYNTDDIVELLDEKDKQISELEAKLAESKEQLIAMNEKSNKIKKESYYLKQQLKSQPAEIVEKIRKWGQKHYNWVGDGTGYDGQDYNECIGFNRAIDQLNEVLGTILKEYGGEDE